LLLAVVAACLFGYALHSKSGIFREFEAALLSVEWMLLVCLAIWCGTFIFLTVSLNDLPLIGLLLIAMAVYFIGYSESSRAADVTIFLTGVTLGKGVRVFLSRSSRRESAPIEHSEIQNQKLGIDQSGLMSAATFHIGLVVLLAFASWWHLDMSANFYHGPRWTGLWDNPDIYGMLMSAGFVLAVGLLAAKRNKRHKENPDFAAKELKEHKENFLFSVRPFLCFLRFFAANKMFVVLFIAAGMMAVGLFFSYSRGAWVGTAVGLLYLAKAYGKFKWRYVVPGAWLVALGALLIWGRTPDDAPWYLKRMDLSRPSAQHRVAAWRGAVQMMRDHPFGVGWNKAVETYQKDYSPPEDGAGAITTNDYLMLGTQLGFPGLLCFVAYVGLCFRKCGARSAECGIEELRIPNSEFRIKTACRAGALALLVAFWFDGGLFKLATASVFWILLELGNSNAEGRMKNAETDQSLVTSAATMKKATAAFTLIELLVVIAIIGILAGLLFPVLARAKERAKGTQCLSNLGQMQIAWNIYADDHQGTLPFNGSGRDAGQYADEPSWVAGYLSTAASHDNTNITMLVGQEFQKWGSIGGYTKNPDIYHCPADLSRDKGNGLFRVRSISMNSWINPGRNGEVSGRFWDLNFEKYTKITDFVRLSPSDGFVFLDERPDSINDGWFMVSMESYNPNDLSGLEVRDLPAINHNRASSFTFADGHAEFHRWLDGRTLAMKFVKAGQPAPDNQDVLWLMQHATRPK
jgi:prepilin-type N-terminal cleavage/methylation domain-containing protein/prepilin-type processing-associated H-X9-DG protein